MKLIDFINITFVGLIFAGISMTMLWSVSKYDYKAFEQGIVRTVNGPGNNFIHKTK